MSIEVVVAKESDKELWEKIVRESIHTHIFHSWEWLKIAEKHTENKLYPLIILKGETPIGIYPVFLNSRHFLKLAFSPPPYTGISYLGPAVLDYHKLKEDKKLSILDGLVKSVNSLLFSEFNASYFLTNLSPKLIDIRPYKWLGYEIEPFFHYSLDLSKGPEEVWRRFKKEARENVKKAIKSGFIAEIGTIEDIKFVYDMLKERYAEQGIRMGMRYEYLKEVCKKFEDNIKIFLCKKDSGYTTGIVALCFKDRISFWIGGAKSGSNYSNDLVHWEAIKWACENGFKYYEEFGAGTERLARFKSKFNPELVICFSVRKYKGFHMKLLEHVYKMGRNYLRI